MQVIMRALRIMRQCVSGKLGIRYVPHSLSKDHLGFSDTANKVRIGFCQKDVRVE